MIDKTLIAKATGLLLDAAHPRKIILQTPAILSRPLSPILII
jgi:hypothetical protein